MKVYTVDVDLNLEVFSSQKAFIAQADSHMSWCDPKYVLVATSNDLKTFYDEPYRHCMVVHDDTHIKAHNILHNLSRK